MQPQTLSPVDRRAFVRYETNEPATANINGKAIPCRLSDISLGGALLEGDLDLDAGSGFALDILDLPTLEVTVVHCGNRYFGVQFRDMQRARGQVENWLRRRTGGH